MSHPSHTATAPVLQTVRLAAARGRRTLFRGLDIALAPGDALWVQGGNGSGKTTLLRLLCGLAVPLDGEVRWRGRGIRQVRDVFHRELLYIGHADGLKDDLSAAENLHFAQALAGTKPQAAAGDALARVGLARAVRLRVGSLSQGQRRRVALARLHQSGVPPLVVLDEPFTALDAAACDALAARLDAHLAAGAIVVYTTHRPVALGGARLHKLDLDAPRALPC